MRRRMRVSECMGGLYAMGGENFTTEGRTVFTTKAPRHEGPQRGRRVLTEDTESTEIEIVLNHDDTTARPFLGERGRSTDYTDGTELFSPPRHEDTKDHEVGRRILTEDAESTESRSPRRHKMHEDARKRYEEF